MRNCIVVLGFQRQLVRNMKSWHENNLGILPLPFQMQNKQITSYPSLSKKIKILVASYNQSPQCCVTTSEEYEILSLEVLCVSSLLYFPQNVCVVLFSPTYRPSVYRRPALLKNFDLFYFCEMSCFPHLRSTRGKYQGGF